MQSEATPWSVWLATAALLGIAPHRFWRLSAREWRALTTPRADETLDRARFAALAARYPDTKHDH